LTARFVSKVSIEMTNFQQALNYVAKAESTPDIPDKSMVMAKLKCASGLAYLNSSKFKVAALCFVEVAFELGSAYNDVSIFSLLDMQRPYLCVILSLDN
jgi:COP9 signalosome complex subunit 1